MRLFWALELPQQVKVRLVSVQRQLRAALAGHLRWVPGEQLHVTCRFLGEVGDPAAIVDAVRGLEPPGPIPLEIQGLGVFGRRRPRVVWAGLGGAGSRTLSVLVTDLDTALGSVGVAPRAEPFVGHVTIARSGRERDAAPARIPPAALTACAFEPLPFLARELVLLSSSHGQHPGPARHVPVARIALQRRGTPPPEHGAPSQ